MAQVGNRGVILSAIFAAAAWATVLSLLLLSLVFLPATHARVVDATTGGPIPDVHTKTRWLRITRPSERIISVTTESWDDLAGGMSWEFEDCLKRRKITEFERAKGLAPKEITQAESDLQAAKSSFEGAGYKWAIIQANRKEET